MYATKFDQLVDAGCDALRHGTTGTSVPPLDGTARWGVSIIVRPIRR